LVSISFTAAGAEPTITTIMLEDVLITMLAVKDETTTFWPIT